MKYAVIGCGRIATNHVKAVLNNNLEFVAACDVELGNIELLLSKHNLEKESSIKRYTDYKDMIANHSDLELVAIATPSGNHAEIALHCIDHGINVIIEKPMAMNMKDAEEIIKCSAERGGEGVCLPPEPVQHCRLENEGSYRGGKVWQTFSRLDPCEVE